MIPHFGYYQLINNSVQIGHNCKNCEFFSGWFVFALRENVTIIDLFKTSISLKYAFSVLSATINVHGPIWFVGLDTVKRSYLMMAALMCGEYFLVSQWINGLISNYLYMFKFLNNQMNIVANTNRNKYKELSENWYRTRYTWPRLLFVSNSLESLSPIKEALDKSITVVTLTDTNAHSQSGHIIIPGNDDSTDSLLFFNFTIANFISQNKFAKVITWFSNIRVRERKVSLKNWLKKMYFEKKTPRFFNMFKLRQPLLPLYTNTLRIFLEKDYRLHKEINEIERYIYKETRQKRLKENYYYSEISCLKKNSEKYNFLFETVEMMNEKLSKLSNNSVN